MRPKFWQIAIVVALTATFTFGVVGFVRAIDDDWFGSFTVQVHERDGIDLSVKVPTFLARAAIRFLPGQVRDQVRSELNEWGPAVCAAYTELENCPDATLISIESESETVYVSMRQRAIVVDVLTEDEKVRVVVPVAMMGEFLDRLELESIL